jgi:hypothetical protein
LAGCDYPQSDHNRLSKYQEEKMNLNNNPIIMILNALIITAIVSGLIAFLIFARH